MKFLFLLALVFGLVSCTQRVQETRPFQTPIIIVHTNDIHGRAWPFLREDGKWVGGYAAQGALISRIRSEASKKNAAFLLFSAGDVNTGVPESDFSEAKPDFEAMKSIRYDAMVAGNHDFDHGVDLLLKQLSWVNFPFLAANLKLKNTQRALLPGELVIEREGIRFGILGVTTDQLNKLILPEHAKNLVLEEANVAVKKSIPKLKMRGAEILIALSHLGVSQSGLSIHRLIPNDDIKLAKNSPELDLIIGGHSHTFINEGMHEGKTLIVQSGYRGDFIGKVEMIWDSEKKQIIKRAASLVEVNPEEGEDPEIKKIVQPYKEKYDSELGVPLFEAKEPILGQRNKTHTLELPLGNLVCDALRSETQSDIAFFNSGGIRSNLPAGIVRRRDVLEAFPFRNLVSTGVLRGRDIVALLNDGIRAGDFSGAVLQVSGLSYEIENGKVSNVLVGQKKIAPDQTYSFSTNSYVSSGGDKLNSILKAQSLRTGPLTVDEVLVRYVSTLKKIAPRIEGRIKLKAPQNP